MDNKLIIGGQHKLRQKYIIHEVKHGSKAFLEKFLWLRFCAPKDNFIGIQSMSKRGKKRRVELFVLDASYVSGNLPNLAHQIPSFSLPTL